MKVQGLAFLLALLIGASPVPTNSHDPPSAKPPVSQEIVDLANKATMTDYAKSIFYNTKPVIDTDRNKFESDCQTPNSSRVIELGCYSTSDNRIYILKIDNPALADEMVATASHEMLHAAYSKLNTQEKQKVDTELESSVPNVSDKQLADELKNYQQVEPGQRDNELHSLLGTQYTPLGTDLESYYSKYFANRDSVVNSYQNFDNKFSSLRDDMDNLETQIKQLRMTMLKYLDTNNISGYNALVPKINELIRKYNNDVTQYNQLSSSLTGEEPPISLH